MIETGVINRYPCLCHLRLGTDLVFGLGAVPLTAIVFPILTARENPAMLSKGLRDETFLRFI